MEYKFNTISVVLDKGVLFATVSNPPCNVMSVEMMLELTKLGEQIAADNNVRVLVLQSADPDFFIVHFEVKVVIDRVVEGLPKKSLEFSPLHKMCIAFHDNPKPSLVKIAGRAGGGGCEIASTCDMRFGVRDKTVFNQMEVPLGLLPGGSGSQNLPRHIGRGRSLEVILSGEDLDAETAEKWGFLNRIFDTVEGMNSYVDELAYRIAKWPAHSVALAKESVGNIDLPWRQGLLEEANLTQYSHFYPITKKLLRKFLELGAQTRDGEKRVSQLCLEATEAVANEIADEDKGRKY